jgi:hypothetical protein
LKKNIILYIIISYLKNNIIKYALYFKFIIIFFFIKKYFNDAWIFFLLILIFSTHNMGRGNNLDTSLCGDGFSNQNPFQFCYSTRVKLIKRFTSKCWNTKCLLRAYGNAGSIAHLSHDWKVVRFNLCLIY